jgi:hypothetical protein
MPDRDDETPQRPYVAERFAEIEQRVRRRSEQAIETATLQAGEILLALGIAPDLADPRLMTVATRLRGYLDDATRELRAELEAAQAEVERIKRVRRAEIERRSRER